MVQNILKINRQGQRIFSRTVASATKAAHPGTSAAGTFAITATRHAGADCWAAPAFATTALACVGRALLVSRRSLASGSLTTKAEDSTDAQVYRQRTWAVSIVSRNDLVARTWGQVKVTKAGATNVQTRAISVC